MTPQSWTGKSVLIIGNDHGAAELAESLVSSGSRVTLATFPTPAEQTSSQAQGSGEYNKETFELDSYDSLVKVFQRTRKREGYVERVVLWAPGGIQGPLVKSDKTLPPPLPKLTAYVVKLAAFEFRWDTRPRGDQVGRGEVGLVLPLPVTNRTILDPVDAAAASSILGITRSLAAQATLDGYKMWMLCPEEPTQPKAPVDGSSLIKAFHGVLDRQHGRPLPSGEENAPVYVSSATGGLTLIDRPDQELNKAEAYKRLADRSAFPTALGTKIRDGIISFTLMAEKLGLEPRQLGVYLAQAALVFYVYLWWKGWVGIPKVFWLAVGAILMKLGIKFGTQGAAKLSTQDGRRPTAVFLGSGGHTSEALQLVSALDHDVYTPRTYIISSGDSMSVEKAVAFERTLSKGSSGQQAYRFIELPRARKVGQSYVSSVPTTLVSFIEAFRVLTIEPLRGKEERRWSLLLINGPGTCVVAAIAVMLPRLFGLHSPRVIYVESWARVRSLSLSGKILKHLVDKFVVQWDEVDRPADAWTARSGDVPPDGRGRKTSLGDYHGWLI